jgi:hypothetical protein
MISDRLRKALTLFANVVLVGGPVFGVVVLASGFAMDHSGEAFGRALLNVTPMIFTSVFCGGVLRLLISIDARLDQKTVGT